MNYVIAAWAVVWVTLGLYALSIIARGRRLATHVPPERRRWIRAEEV